MYSKTLKAGFKQHRTQRQQQREMSREKEAWRGKWYRSRRSNRAAPQLSTSHDDEMSVRARAPSQSNRARWPAQVAAQHDSLRAGPQRNVSASRGLRKVAQSARSLTLDKSESQDGAWVGSDGFGGEASSVEDTYSRVAPYDSARDLG